jgi:hypothetical protein
MLLEIFVVLLQAFLLGTYATYFVRPLHVGQVVRIDELCHLTSEICRLIYHKGSVLSCVRVTGGRD